MTKQRKGKRRTKAEYTRSLADNAIVSTLGKLEESWMKENANSKAKRDNKTLFGKHCNDEGRSREEAK